MNHKRPIVISQDAHSKKIFSNNLRGQSAWERHQEHVSRYLNVYGDGGTALKARLKANNRNDWDILKERHRFLRDEDDTSTSLINGQSSSGSLAYEDEVAKRYYNNLFKEYAIADMKHYKSGNVALRWRSEEDVVDGIGQFTCANNRCDHHRQLQDRVELTPYEMNFAYEETSVIKEGTPAIKNALVKIVLCPRCARKLRYKSDRERNKQRQSSRSRSPKRSSNRSPRHS